MGSVYRAERVDGQSDRRVAIRVLRAGLKHPYIAQLIDGGSVEGLSYIVIELIDGTPIDAHCKGLHLNLRDRLQLFILVCESVQHAHASLIVHRDLKPANILVTSDGKLMVEKSLTYLNRLASDSNLRPQFTQELARAYRQGGDIQGHRRTLHFGLFEDSRKSHLKGIAMEESLPRQDAANPKRRSQLAWGDSHLAELYSMRSESSSLGRVLLFEGRLPEASLLKWATEEAMYLGRIAPALQYTQRQIELLAQVQLTGNRRSRLFTAHRDRSSLLSQAANPNEERHCDAIEDLKFAREGQGDIFNQDPRSISRMIQAGSELKMLSASQALSGKPDAIETAKRGIALFNRDKKRVNTDLDWDLAFAQLKLGKVSEADPTLRQVKNTVLSILELARNKRKPILSSIGFAQHSYRYHRAHHILLGRQSGDTNKALREERLKLLDTFPSSGVARSIERMGQELRK